MSAESAIKLAAVGVSLIVTMGGASPQSRFLTGQSFGSQPTFGLPFAVKLSPSASIQRAGGYTPRTTFDNPITSSECQGGATVYSTLSTTTTITTTTRTSTSTTTTIAIVTNTSTAPRVNLTTQQDVPTGTPTRAGGVLDATEPDASIATASPGNASTADTVNDAATGAQAEEDGNFAVFVGIGVAIAFCFLGVGLLAMKWRTRVAEKKELDEEMEDFAHAAAMLRRDSKVNLAETSMDNAHYDAGNGNGDTEGEGYLNITAANNENTSEYGIDGAEGAGGTLSDDDDKSDSSSDSESDVEEVQREDPSSYFFGDRSNPAYAIVANVLAQVKANEATTDFENEHNLLEMEKAKKEDQVRREQSAANVAKIQALTGIDPNAPPLTKAESKTLFEDLANSFYNC